ncbi:LacI family transcriptional regulator [Ruania suaedae]|uniref:LacI family DNA-binding transcriptional regulator n=1 Tax=Ruania suaedae TaxID=2897774 RepID=UPI001E2AAC8E|nr:LacI family DNA-binding transcriptional regulator [Ruania suaedae]UFU03587.1 LacI family transcriptional regulator [Ruania suaedae]
MPSQPTAPRKRPTIADVARLAGVSPSAVSHAFNARPNVSAETAVRIRAAADELNWRPNVASRRVSGAAGRSLGLVISQDGTSFRRDPFFVRLLAGLTAPLAEIGWSLSLTVVDPPDETEIYRQWWNEQRVDGFLLVDLRTDDARPPLLQSLGAPAVLLGSPIPGATAPAVTLADEAALVDVLGHLAALGHRDVARVDSAARLAHVRERSQRFVAAAARHAMTASVLRWPADAEDPVQQVLRERGRATALIVDSESIAASIVSHAPEVGVQVPEDVSVIAWEDSWVSQLVRPRLTALEAPVEASARIAVDLLARLARGESVDSVMVPGRSLVVRESTGPAPS